MAPYEHNITGTVVVNATDPAVDGPARYMVAKIVDNEVWYHASYDDLETASTVVKESETIPMFVIDRNA